MRKLTADDFWRRKRIDGECWIFTGALDKQSGYGQLSFRGKHITAHRLSYILTHREIPHGKQINHLCNNKGCINPDHLYAGTHYENLRDAMVFGAWKNSKSGAERLHAVERFRKKTHDTQKIRELRENGMLMREIGALFGITESAVSYILSGKRRTKTDAPKKYSKIRIMFGIE